MTSSEVRVGLVGYGFGGRYFHAQVDPWDAAATATVLDADRRSAAEGRSVDVPAVCR